MLLGAIKLSKCTLLLLVIQGTRSVRLSSAGALSPGAPERKAATQERETDCKCGWLPNLPSFHHRHIASMSPGMPYDGIPYGYVAVSALTQGQYPIGMKNRKGKSSFSVPLLS